jgi:UDP-N-acetylmuramoyl-tripeptide--D-alanyl-D-alanine ligase
LQLEEIALLCGASHNLNPQLALSKPAGFALDSRAIKPGELFIAVPGERVDGHRFVQEVLDKGACAALVAHQRLAATKLLPADLGAYFDKLIFVENTACALQQLAARVLAQWGKPVVGVTGSAGKTTMKDLIAHVLTVKGRVLKSPGNLNTSYGLPLTIGRMISGGARPADFELAVLEMGMSSFGEIARLADLAQPRVGVVGNVGTAHIEFFGSQARIARAKAELIDGLQTGGTAVLNADDPLVARMKARRNDIAVISFGIENAADVVASELASLPDLSGTRFKLRSGQAEAEVKLPLLGRHNVYNALAAAATGCAFGLSMEQIAAQLATAAPSTMRGEVINLTNGATLIDDSYNSNPQALLQAVRALTEARGQVPGATGARCVVVAGEMLELGEQAAELHRQCGVQMQALGVERLLGVRGQARELVTGARAAGMPDSAATFHETTEEAAEALLNEIKPGDLILVKGSRGVRTERVVARLKNELGKTGELLLPETAA